MIANIWLEPEAELSGRAGQFIIVETDDDSWADFTARIDDDELICGEMLYTRRGYNGKIVIYRRTPIAFRGCTVNRAHPNEYDLIEEDAA